MITDKQWNVFRLILQEDKGIVKTAQIMKINTTEVRNLLKQLKIEQPELFFTRQRRKPKQYHEWMDPYVKIKF